MAPPVNLLAFLGENEIFLGEDKRYFWVGIIMGCFFVIVTHVPGNKSFGGNWAGLNEN